MNAPQHETAKGSGGRRSLPGVVFWAAVSGLMAAAVAALPAGYLAAPFAAGGGESAAAVGIDEAKFGQTEFVALAIFAALFGVLTCRTAGRYVGSLVALAAATAAGSVLGLANHPARPTDSEMFATGIVWGVTTGLLLAVFVQFADRRWLRRPAVQVNLRGLLVVTAGFVMLASFLTWRALHYKAQDQLVRTGGHGPTVQAPADAGRHF